MPLAATRKIIEDEKGRLVQRPCRAVPGVPGSLA